MEKIKIDDFTKYKFLSGIKHSPDGKYGCYVVHESDLENNKYLSNLWILNLKDNSSYQLTTFDSERAFTWLDNENIIFPGMRSDKDKELKNSGEEFTQYYKINIHGGEAVKYFRIPKNVGAIKAIDEDNFIFTSDYNMNQRDLNSLSEEAKEKELKARKEEKDYEVLEEIPYWSNGGGFTSKHRNRLYLFNKTSGKVEAVTDEYINVELFTVNKEKSKVLLLLSYFKDKMELTNYLAIYDLKKKEISKLDEQGKMGHSYAEFLDEDTIIFSGTEMKNFGVNENDKLYIMKLSTKEVTCITPDLDVAMTNSVGSDARYGGSALKQVEDGYLYFVTTEGDSSLLNRVNKEGKIERIISGEGSVDGISVKGEEVLFIGMKKDKLQELFILKGKEETKISDFNGWVYKERSVVSTEKVTVETAPGVVIEGWILKPVDFDENKKYPAILDIHGGPKTVYGTVFYNEMQYWANEGYAVFFCNPRGSDGRGNEFADIRGKYGTIDYDDLMKFTDAVLEKYTFIDKEKVGVTGGSYGGFMTNWIIGHTDRFKAAASQRSISNWISMGYTTDIGYFFAEDQNGDVTPWCNEEKLWFHSPLKYADKVKTPTLFLHSEEDYRCWLPEALQMFTALKYHGVEARLCMFRGENHELSRSGKPKHRLRRLKEITEWFNKHLKEQ